MFCRFIRNKVLTAFLVLSSFAFGARGEQTHTRGAETLDINGMTFYIPAPEPSRAELKQQATLMYAEKWDRQTGKITKTKYPDTLNLPDNPPLHTPETPEDLELLLGPYAFLAKPAKSPVPQQPATTPPPAPQPQPDLTPTNTPLSELSQSATSTPTTADISFDIPKDTMATSASTQEIEELIRLLEQEVAPSATNNPSVTDIPATVQPTITNDTPVVQDTSVTAPEPQPETPAPQPLVQTAQAPESPAPQAKISEPPAPQPAETISKSATQEVEELQALLEELTPAPTTQASNSTPENQPNDNDFGKGFLIGFASAIALTGLSKLRPFAKPAHNLRPSRPLPQYDDLIRNDPTRLTTPDKRQEMADRLHALRTLQDIKRQRSRLTRAMARARQVSDTETIAAITRQRQELTQKRREACYRLTNPHMAEIKEKRRLLTKQMTIARRNRDTRTMAQITDARQALCDQVKGLNAFVRTCDYHATRQAFLKPAILARLQSPTRD